LLNNAQEASRPEDKIQLGGREISKDNVSFFVRNPQVMSADVRLQIFKRSFSTKGSGRGIGTYSVKLLAENYLKGSASFLSNVEEGTEFEVTLPVSPELEC